MNHGPDMHVMDMHCWQPGYMHSSPSYHYAVLGSGQWYRRGARIYAYLAHAVWTTDEALMAIERSA